MIVFPLCPEYFISPIMLFADELDRGPSNAIVIPDVIMCSGQ